MPIAASGLLVYNITEKKVEARKTSSFEGCKVSKSIPDEGERTALTTLGGGRNGQIIQEKTENQPLDRQTHRQKTFPAPNGLVS